MKIRVKSLQELVDHAFFQGIDNDSVRLLTIDSSYMSCKLDIDCCEQEIEIFADRYNRYRSEDYDFNFYLVESGRQGLIANLSEVADIIEDDKVHELCFGTIIYNDDGFVLSSAGKETYFYRKEVVDVVNYFLDCLGYDGINE